MRKNVKVLDCTLRDGGYVNDWNFGHSVISGIYRRLDNAGIEFVEVGFLDERVPFNMDKSIQPSTDCMDKVYGSIIKNKAIPVAMIDYGTCSLERIGEAATSFIKGIRVIFKKEKIEEALPFCEKIKDKGYMLFIQAISITSYSDMEMLQYIAKINAIKPYAFSIVDTYGLLNKDKLSKYFLLIDNNLDPSIKVGYHAHNNFQLAYSNTIHILEMNTNRDLIVDSTVYGMGKNAGNCATELLAMHMNDYYSMKYDMDQILEIIDTDLMAIYEKNNWGYQYNYYISALQNCHHDYVKYLLRKKTLSVKSINFILDKIPEDKKLVFDSEYIHKAYLEYQRIQINDKADLENIKNKLCGSSLLLVGPGNSIIKQKDDICSFVEKVNPQIISINFVLQYLKSNFVFISNAKRYSKLEDDLNGEKINSEIILTSNITPLEYQADYILNYESLLFENKKDGSKLDNGLLLLLNALVKLEIKEVYLAGFDGYSTVKANYYKPEYSLNNDSVFGRESNETISKSLESISEDIKLHFITNTLYKA